MWAIRAVVCGLLVEGDPHASTDASTAGSAPADVVDRLAHPTDADVAAVDAWWRASNYLITCLTDAIEPAMCAFEIATLAEADLFGRLGAACGGGKH